MRAKVEKIQKSHKKIGISITGGGTEVISELLKNGGGSKVVYFTDVPYNQESMKNFLDLTPENYCSPETSRLMAMKSFLKLLEINNKDYSFSTLLAIGVTCSLNSGPNERKERKHKAFITLQTHKETKTYEVYFKKKLARNIEEKIISEYILSVLYDNCYDVVGVAVNMTNNSLESKIDTKRYSANKIAFTDNYTSIFENDFLTFMKLDPYLGWRPNSFLYTSSDRQQVRNNLIFPGSFNPIHEGHLTIMKTAHELTKKKIYLELSIENVDKPFLNYLDLHNRLSKIKNELILNESPCDTVILSRAATFYKKCYKYPESTFIIGEDTYFRLTAKEYYRSESDIENFYKALQENKNRFLVFHRNGYENVNINNPATIREFCDFVPIDSYKDSGISSSQIRKEKAKEPEKLQEDFVF